MAEVIFYEKPGCINNTKQKRMLAFTGHLVVTKNLLTEAWCRERLQQFFSNMPVSEWFNRTAPMVRDGVIDLDVIDGGSAITEMMAEPLLIRRPLMFVDGVPVVSFDARQLNGDFDLQLPLDDEDMESCPHDPEHENGCEVKV